VISSRAGANYGRRERRGDSLRSIGC
jgi:hypothetical protein